MKKIAVINDLSGMGKCSLTAAIPVISVMGVQAVPLPTAVLSAQTGFPSYYYDDYTEHMDDIIREWKKMDFCPDGIYTGFLAGAAQADKVLEFIDLFAKEDTRILVDPVMGDNGEEYPIYTEELCERMRILAQRASVITPNLTEALLLLYGKERTRQIRRSFMEISGGKLSGVSEDLSGNSRNPSESSGNLSEDGCEELKENIQEIGRKLSEKFDTEVVITGIDLPSDGKAPRMGNLICRRPVENQDKNRPENGRENQQKMREDSAENESPAVWITSEKEGGSYSGTGDLFASVLAAGMVKGTDTAESVRRAASFLSRAIHDAVLEGTDRNEGVCFETYLHTLA